MDLWQLKTLLKLNDPRPPVMFDWDSLPEFDKWQYLQLVDDYRTQFLKLVIGEN